MIHDPALLDALSNLPVEEFEGRVFRTTGELADPVAFSQNGGRWAMISDREGGCPILYTSTTSEGAIAEVASYLGLLTPIPRKDLRVHELALSLDKTLRVAVADFAQLGIEPDSYMDRNYLQTQKVGAAINFLELDGLIAPSARWDCNNIMIFGDNHSLDKGLEVISSRIVTVQEWHRFAMRS